jgi:hypothetical protein
MEDLIPFLVFGVVALANFAQFVAKQKKRAQQNGEESASSGTASFSQIFERLTEELAPKIEIEEEWPDNFKRPDYAHEMEDFLHTKDDSIEAQNIVFEPELQNEESEFIQDVSFEIPEHHPFKSSKSVLSGSHGLRMMSATNKNGRNGFRIRGKQELKRALKAHIIFSPPRAMDTSFENGITK